MTPNNENRVHRRIELRMGAGVSVVSGFLGDLIRKPQFECFTRDVSVQGMKVVSGRPLPEGADVRLWITLPGEGVGSAVQLRGKVCWAKAPSGVTREWHAGIRLDNQSGHPDGVWANTIRGKIRAHYYNAMYGVAS